MNCFLFLHAAPNYTRKVEGNHHPLKSEMDWEVTVQDQCHGKARASYSTPFMVLSATAYSGIEPATNPRPLFCHQTPFMDALHAVAGTSSVREFGLRGSPADRSWYLQACKEGSRPRQVLLCGN